jgi:hypothetical protein
MATCPNKSSEAWKLLVASRGEDAAHYLWDKYEGDVPSEYNTSLNEKLVNGFLKDFGITVTEYNDLKEDLGIDSYSASDLITKAIAYKKGQSITPEVAYFAYSMLGQKNNKIRSNLRYLVNKWDKYQERFDYHSKIVKETEGFIDDKRDWQNTVRDRVIIDFLKENIEDYYRAPQPFEKSLDTRWVRGVDKFSADDYTIWESIVKFIEDILSNFSSKYKSRENQLADLGRAIAEEILNENYEYFNYSLGEEQVQKYYNKTIESDPFAKNLVEFGQKDLGLVLTGSLALRKAGSVYRTASETLHDIDWVVPFNLNSSDVNRDVLEKIYEYQQKYIDGVKELSPSSSSYIDDVSKLKETLTRDCLSEIENFEWFKQFKEKYPTYELLGGFYGGEHGDFESFTVQGVIDPKRYSSFGTHKEIFNSYKKDPKTKAPIVEKKEVLVPHLKGDIVKDTGYVIDFFIRLQDNQEEHENYFKLWKEIMIAKLQMGRDKDFIDWKAFIPYIKSQDSFNFNYSGFRHFNYESSETNALEEAAPKVEQQALFQLPKEGQKPASPELIKLMKEFIKQIGVDYKLVENIIVDGVKQDANGVALIMQKLIQVVEGQEEVALPEEAMHFAVEIVKQTNPKLYQQLLKEINTHPKFKEVIDLYGDNPLYQKDGRRDIAKLKEEAIAQVLVDKAEDIVGRSWWERILDWLTPRFLKSGLSKASMDVLAGRIASVEDIDVSKGSVYFQLTEGERVFDLIKQTSNSLELKEDGTKEDGKPKKSYFIGEDKIKNRVSDRVKEFYEELFGTDLNEDEFIKTLNDLKSEKGTEKHGVLEYAQSIYVDPETGLLREEPLDDSEYVNGLNNVDRDIYIALRDNLRERLIAFDEKAPGTRFMSEITIVDPKRSVAGTVDFLAITPEGKVNILDWKFMDLSTDKYEDVPWYKVKAWNMQMTDYKNILISNYKLKNEDFQQTRMIPILAIYTPADYQREILPRLKEIKIGDVNVQNIKEDYLLPVGITQEKTGNKKIDSLIEKLNNTYKKLSEEKVTDTEKANKAEQLNSLYKAIRHLQIKGNVVPLINQAKVLNKQVSMLMDRYKSDFEGKENENIPQDKINAFAGMIRIHLEGLIPYLDLKQLRFMLSEDTEENAKLKTELNNTLEKVENYISELEDLDIEFGEKFNSASSTSEKVVKGFSKWFSSMSTLQIANVQSLYKLANKAFGIAESETLDEVKRLNTLKDNYEKWASSKGLSLKDYFNIIIKGDKNELIDEFDRKFYDELKAKVAKKDHAWVLDNIDVDAYKEYIDEKIKEKTNEIVSRPRVGTVEEVKLIVKKELAKMYNKYDLKSTTSNGWLLAQEVKKFPRRDKWESAEWKELNKQDASGNYINQPAIDFYNYIIERNNYYQGIGYLQGKAARKFLPWVRKGFVEGLAFDGATRGVGEQFLRNISMDEAEAGLGQTDPTTGQLINVVPRYFTKDFGKGYSTDLFKTIALYNQFAIKFKNLKQIEESALQLLRLERNKKSIMTSRFGKIIKEGDDFKYVDNSENSQLLEDMIKAVVYQQKYIESEVFDAYLGKISGFGKNINDKLGMKIFPEDLEERQLSANKLIDTVNTQFQLTTLGLNSLSAISNLFGGTANGLINAGKYFTKLDYVKTQMWMLTNKMQGTILGKSSLGDDPKKAIAALDYFLPFLESYNRDAAKNLSLNKFDEQQIQDFLMYFMRKGEQAVQTLNFFAFLKNAIVVDGKIVNVREYLRNTDEYKNFYAGTQQERKARKDKFDKDAEALIDEKGVLKVGEIKDGEFVIPGVDKKSDSVIEFRRLVQSFTSDALGSMSEENRRKVNMNVYSSSVMVFKNWIPRLVDVRIGNMKYNAASDAYEWGRMRMIFGMLTTDIMKSIKSTQAAIGGDGDVWLAQVRDLYEKKRKEYKDNTGKDLDMTEDEFISLVNQNIKNQVTDLVILLSLATLLAGLKAAAPDDDEEVIVKNQWKFYVKATDKLTDELMYFYDPTSPFDLISGKGGIVPSLGLLENYFKFTQNFVLENFGIIIGDEEMQDDAKPIKYLMKSFPVSNQAAGYLPMFYPELAKDLDIKVQSNYGMR